MKRKNGSLYSETRTPKRYGEKGLKVLFAFIFLLTFMAQPAFSGNNAGAAFSVWPDTGQAKCYDDNSKAIPCPSEGEPFYGQDAQYQGPQRRYTKLGYIDGQLVELPDSATPYDGWIMTRDNVTGLIWEVKTNKDDTEDYTNPHDADNHYTWCDTNPATNGGDQGTCGDGTDTEDFINDLNSAHFGGFSDWRLPTIKELSTINMDMRYFPNKKDVAYVSSTTAISSPSDVFPANLYRYVWTVVYEDGLAYTLSDFKDSKHLVRAVRGNSSHNNCHFIDNHDGTITDTETGLMWQKCSMGQLYNPNTGRCDGNAEGYLWKDALAACEDLSLAGYSDWRLPNHNEVHSIVDYSKIYPAIDIDYFPDTVAADYWSSTTDVSEVIIAWVANFATGGIYWNNKRRYYLGVRCVRSGHTGPFNDLTIFLQGSGTGTVNGTATTTPSTPDRSCQSGPCVWPYPENTEVTLTATPDAGYAFVGWGGACEVCGSNDECTITMDEHKTCSAVFEEQTFEPPVITSFTADPTEGDAPLSVTFTCNATDPDGGDIESIEWYFGDSQWPDLTVHNNFTRTHVYQNPGTYTAYCVVWDDEDQNATSGNITITVNAPVTYFQLDVNVTPEEGTGGIVTSNTEDISCPGQCSASYEAGANVTLTAEPSEGFTFTGWGGDCSECGTSETCTITMDADKTCSAVFEEIPNQPPVIDSFVVEPSSGTAPLDVAVICQATDPDGSIESYEFNPGDGSDPLTSEDGTFSYTYDTPGSYNATCTAYDNDEASVTSDPVTVTVTAPVTYYNLEVQVTPADGTGGIVTSNTEDISCPDNCSHNYEAGANVTITAEPAEGFTFSGWGGACEPCGTNSQCTITMDANKTCSAVFEEIQNEPPVIDSFTVDPSSGTAPLEVAVICEATDPDGNITAYEFNPDDGSAPITSDNGTFSYTYSIPGSYNATCTAYDSDGASVTSDPVTVTVEEAGPSWNDISEGISYTSSRTLYDRINRAFFVLIDVTNNTGADIAGPVRMVLESSSLDLKSGCPGLEPDGYTDDGKPYFIIVPEGETWDSGETLEDLRLNFVLQRKRLTFELRFEEYGR